jgi:Tol biopolymer transport system component
VIPRVLLAGGLAILMLVTGVTSYLYMGTRQSRIAAPIQKPPTATPGPKTFTLPGTLYLTQSGAIYSLSAGRFHQLTAEDGWMQPSANPEGGLIAVKRSPMFSDVYSMNRLGQVTAQLTNNQAAPRDRWDPGANAWAFYPRLSADGRTLWVSYDGPKYVNYGIPIYEVDLAVWAVPPGAPIRQGRMWTDSNGYTGGDVQPVPLAGGGIIYTKYSYDQDLNRVGQLWYTNRAGSYGNPLTPQAASCAQPSISPDGGSIAMICTYGKQVSKLVLASWNGSSPGALRTVISDQLVAQPAWAPDGSGIAYLAPGSAGAFQLWFLPKNAYNPPAPSPVPTPTPTPGGPHNGPLPSPTPSALPTPPVIKPIRLFPDLNLGLDATSPIVWIS